ncbi:hypothetical protein NN561_001337 [Cricetulus griseus]
MTTVTRTLPSANRRLRFPRPHKRPSASPGSSVRISAPSLQVLPPPSFSFQFLVHAKQPSLFSTPSSYRSRLERPSPTQDRPQ